MSATPSFRFYIPLPVRQSVRIEIGSRYTDFREIL